jgi:hypothetical protein
MPGLSCFSGCIIAGVVMKPSWPQPSRGELVEIDARPIRETTAAQG